MLTHLVQAHDKVPLIMKMTSVALFIGSVITAHFVYYDRSVRKRAPTETGADLETDLNGMAPGKGDGADSGSDVGSV